MRTVIFFAGTRLDNVIAYEAIAEALRKKGFSPLFYALNDQVDAHLTGHGFRTFRPFDPPKAKRFRRLASIFRHIPGCTMFARFADIAAIKAYGFAIVDKERPVAAVLSSDTDCSAEYFLAVKVPSVVPQITFDSSGVDQLKLTINFKKFPSTRGQRLLESVLPPLWLMQFPTLGGERTVAWSSVMRTLALIFFGYPMQCIRKGGGYAKKVCLNGAAFVPIFRSYDIKEEKLIATGSAEHDQFQKFVREYTREDSMRHLGLDQPCCTIFLTININDYVNKVLRVIGMIEEIHGKIPVLVKIHPREKKEHFIELEQRFPQVKVHDESTFAMNGHLINASEFVILEESTLGFRAVACDRPLLTYRIPDPLDQSLADYFAHINTELHATTFEGIHAALKRLHDRRERDAIAAKQKELFGPYLTTDGHAVDRIAECVEKIALVSSEA
jgi:hypothetical protein